jgi:large conductance mechanosensitive channel
MGMLKEFRDFAIKGNAVDMAVGIIIGGAFGKIVASLVNDVIMPPIGMLLGGADFSNLSITLKAAIEKTAATPAVAAVTINYGKFINNVLDFTIIALCIFMVVKQMNRLMPKPAAEVTTKTCPQCLSAIPLKAVRCAHCTSMLET